jgi:hypothetical protein
MDVEVVSVKQRPDLADELWNFDDGWPRFMREDQVGSFMSGLPELFPEFQLLLVDRDNGEVVGKAHAVPFQWSESPELPDRGWDEVLGRAIRGKPRGRVPTAVSAIEISIRRHLRGRNLSGVALAGMRDAAKAQGFADLFAPVRPTGKSDEPRTPMSDYAFRTRPDGLPADPWLRVHVRAGGRIVRVAPASMVISGSLAEWRDWTGLPFDTTGEVIVPDALIPVRASVEHDNAVYVEPNVWVHHRL